MSKTTLTDKLIAAANTAGVKDNHVVIDSATFFDNAPKGVTEKSWAKHEDYRDKYAVATMGATAKVFEDHSEGEVSAEFGMGDNTTARPAIVFNEGGDTTAVLRVECTLSTENRDAFNEIDDWVKANM